EDARPVAALAAVAYVLPLVVGMWAAWRVAARQRAVSDERAPVSAAAAVRAGLGAAVLVVTTVLLLLAEGAALAALPVTPGEHDADGRYVHAPRSPRDPGSRVAECSGRPAVRLPVIMGTKRARSDALRAPMAELDVPRIYVPTFDVPELPDLPVVRVPDAPVEPTP